MAWRKNEPTSPTFREALETQKVCDAVLAVPQNRAGGSTSLEQSQSTIDGPRRMRCRDQLRSACCA